MWAGLASHGKPIQHAHVPIPLNLWDVRTPVAGPPVAFEPPSAGFALDWRSLAAMRARGIAFATLTHPAGISSSGDPGLDSTVSSRSTSLTRSRRRPPRQSNAPAAAASWQSAAHRVRTLVFKNSSSHSVR
jgi:hypothetical protein